VYIVNFAVNGFAVARPDRPEDGVQQVSRKNLGAQSTNHSATEVSLGRHRPEQLCQTIRDVPRLPACATGARNYCV